MKMTPFRYQSRFKKILITNIDLDLSYPHQQHATVIIGTSGWRCSRSPLGGWLATTFVDRYFHRYFVFFSIFSSPSRPFLIEGVLGSKNLFSKSGSKWPITWGYTPFLTLLAILGTPGGHFGFCRRCGVAGGEREPPAPLGWYVL